MVVRYPYTRGNTCRLGDGRRHGRRGRDGHARARGRARHRARPARVPAGLVVRDADPVLVAEHPDLASSPAMKAASGEALRIAGASILDDVAHLDLYSCFASSVHFAQVMRSVSTVSAIPRGLTVTGGLPYHGGPASGYLTHSIAAMVEQLRAEPEATGLVSGVGMHMTKHAFFGVYRRRTAWTGRTAARCRRPSCRRRLRPRAGLDPGGRGTRRRRHGRAPISVVHGRDGAPEWALAGVRSAPGGKRTYAQATDDPGSVRRRRNN